MTQVIDMGGFKNEIIEIHFAGDVYNIQLDPPIEAYRQLIEILGTKINTEDDWLKVKELVATIVCTNNPQVNREEFINSLTKISTMRFINCYRDLLYESSDLKNSSNPPSETNQSKEEK